MDLNCFKYFDTYRDDNSTGKCVTAMETGVASGVSMTTSLKFDNQFKIWI
jgi:hypothetical protein